MIILPSLTVAKDSTTEDKSGLVLRGWLREGRTLNRGLTSGGKGREGVELMDDVDNCWDDWGSFL